MFVVLAIFTASRVVESSNQFADSQIVGAQTVAVCATFSLYPTSLHVFGKLGQKERHCLVLYQILSYFVYIPSETQFVDFQAPPSSCCDTLPQWLLRSIVAAGGVLPGDMATSSANPRFCAGPPQESAHKLEMKEVRLVHVRIRNNHI